MCRMSSLIFPYREYVSGYYKKIIFIDVFIVFFFLNSDSVLLDNSGNALKRMISLRITA